MSINNANSGPSACGGCAVGCAAGVPNDLDDAPVSARALVQVVMVLFGIPLVALIVTVGSTPESLPLGMRAMVVFSVLGLTLGITSRSGDRLVDFITASSKSG